MGVTDLSGGWRLSSVDVEAVTFAPFDLIVVSYQPERDELTSKAVTWELPPFADSHFQMLGLRPDDHWKLELFPAIDNGEPGHPDANLRNPGAASSVRTRWLLDTALEELDLAEPMADASLRPDATYYFLLELVTTSGRMRMQTVDSFSSSKDTYDWPVWRKRVPIGMKYQILVLS